MTRAEFLSALHPTGFRDYRAFGTTTTVYSEPAGSVAADPWVQEQVDRMNNVFVGVATRIRHEGRALEDCGELHALFADFDFKDTPEDVVLERLRAVPFPSIVVESGGGLHAYWLLQQPLDLQNGGAPDAKRLLLSLAVGLGADVSAAEPARILRLPGTKNFKYDPPRDVTIKVFDAARRFTVAEVIGRLLQVRPSRTAVRGPAIDHGVPLDKRVEFARAWLATQQPAIEGQHGDDHTYRICCSVVIGHDLPEEEGYRALHDWNSLCKPPWSERDLRAKIRSAEKSGKGCRGEKLWLHTTPDTFKATEQGDAEFFAACFADLVRFDHRRGRWLLFDGHRWAPQTDGEINRLAIDAIRARQAAALTISDPDTRKSRMGWAIGGERRSRQSNLLALARSVKPLADAGENWDTDSWLLGVPNGVVDLRTGTLRPGQPEDRITMCTRAPFDPDATCPLWDQTLAQIFDHQTELIDYFDRYLGYSLTGDCREETLALCWGNGANGKGTTMNTIGWSLGDYADDLPFSALEMHDRSSIPNDIAKIVGKRFVTSSETGETRRLNEARVKALTGRDPITARFLHREFFSFQPVAKFWLATNQKPLVHDTSVGFWRRIHLIPFAKSFADKPDLQLKDRLRDELPGILARAVRGCLAWQRDGLNPPAAVLEATDSYRADSMPVARFLDECCVIEDGARAQFRQLFDSYRWWCSKAKEPRLTSRQFGDEMHAQFKTDPSNTQRVVFLGVKVARLWSEEDM